LTAGSSKKLITLFPFQKYSITDYQNHYTSRSLFYHL